MHIPHRKKSSLLLAISLIVFLSAIPCLSYADGMTGQQWLEKLKKTSHEKDVAIAMILAGDVLFQWDGKSHCKPNNATVGQAVEITIKYIKDRPEIWHLNAVNLIGAALGIAWPCEPQTQKNHP